MPVSVGWVLAQPDLALRLRGGVAGVRREIGLVVTTELEEPFQWLSGGELVLTTGMGLPAPGPGRGEYLRRFAECGVAAIGFGTGLSYDEVPPDLIGTADEIGIPLLEVPLATAFAAIVERVSARIAEVQYEAVLRASRAQPRMTRALIKSGSRAIVRELAGSLGATVLVLDPGGNVTDSGPGEVDAEVLHEVRAVVTADAARAGVHTRTSGASITFQRIGVDRRLHGVLVVVSAAPLGAVDQILLGHANSLLALDFEKPIRLRSTEHRLNTQALGLLLGEPGDPSAAWEQLGQAADGRGRIEVLLAECDSDEAVAAVSTALGEAVIVAGYPLFLHTSGRRVVVVLPADGGFGGLSDAESLGGVRGFVRLGRSGPHPVRGLTDAVAAARLAASTAERGGPAADFAAQSLLSFAATREVLDAVARTTLAPLIEHDRRYGTDLLGSLRGFLEANGQWESAAAATGVHRHTLRKRIATATEILDCDLDSARVRAELLLAILALS